MVHGFAEPFLEDVCGAVSISYCFKTVWKACGEVAKGLFKVFVR